MPYKPNPNNIRLGMPVVSQIYRLKGIASSKVESLNGMVKFGFYVRGESDAKGKLELFDAPDLSPLDDPDYQEIECTEPFVKPNLTLGDEVACDVFNIKGLLTDILTNISGNIYGGITTITKDGSSKLHSLPIQTLKHVKPKIEVKNKETGSISLTSTISKTAY